MALWWVIFKGVDVIYDYTVDEKEFKRCQYSVSKNLSVLFNFSILMCEFVLSYAIRNVEKKYKETLVIPAYVYILYMLLINIMNSQNGVNVVIQDYFDIIGTIMNTLVIIYYLFLIKFIVIFKSNPINESSVSIKVFKENPSFNSLNNSLENLRSLKQMKDNSGLNSLNNSYENLRSVKFVKDNNLNGSLNNLKSGSQQRLI